MTLKISEQIYRIKNVLIAKNVREPISLQSKFGQGHPVGQPALQGQLSSHFTDSRIHLDEHSWSSGSLNSELKN